jgi:hypothetical protein
VSLTHIPHEDLRQALQLTLAVDAVLSLSLGGVVDELGETPVYPVTRVRVRGRQQGPIAGNSIWECEAEIDVFSEYDGSAQVTPIANAIAGLLDLQALAVSGWTVIEMSVLELYRVGETVIADKLAYQWQMPVLIHVVRA